MLFVVSYDIYFLTLFLRVPINTYTYICLAYFFSLHGPDVKDCQYTLRFLMHTRHMPRDEMRLRKCNYVLITFSYSHPLPLPQSSSEYSPYSGFDVVHLTVIYLYLRLPSDTSDLKK